MAASLTDSDLERVRLAVSEAEQRTSGEIVPYLVQRSGTYEVAVWRAASVAALLAMGIGIGILQAYDGWGLGWLYTAWGMALLISVSAVSAAVLVATVPPLKRLFAGSGRMTEAVHRRASLAFLQEEVFNTRDRTGILLFVSLFEHRIEVIGDEGINQQVSEDAWVDIVDTIRRGVKGGHLADGLVEAIGMCGRLLEKKGVEIQPDDTDELPDDVRLRDE